MGGLLGHNRNYFILWTGQSLSGLGSWINFIALNALIFHLYGSAHLLGLFLVIRLLPTMIFGLVGGVAADRFDRRRLLIFTDLVRGLLVLSFVFIQHPIQFMIAGFLLSALQSTFTAGMGAFLPALVERKDLLEANALQRASVSVVTILGPALGGLIIGTMGYPAAFVIDAASFAISVISLLLVCPRNPVALRERSRPVIKQMGTIWALVVGHGALLVLLGVRLLDALGSGTYNTALPIFSEGRTILAGGSLYGYLIAVWGLGGMLGTWLPGLLARVPGLTRETVFCAAVVLMAAGMGATFLTGSILLSFIAIFLGGAGDGASSVVFNTVLMEDSPEEHRGAVFGSISGAVFGAMGLGMLLAGWAAAHLPLAPVVGAGSLLIIAGALTGAFLLRWKKKAKS